MSVVNWSIIRYAVKYGQNTMYIPVYSMLPLYFITQGDKDSGKYDNVKL